MGGMGSPHMGKRGVEDFLGPSLASGARHGKDEPCGVRPVHKKKGAVRIRPWQGARENSRNGVTWRAGNTVGEVCATCTRVYIYKHVYLQSIYHLLALHASSARSARARWRSAGVFVPIANSALARERTPERERSVGGSGASGGGGCFDSGCCFGVLSLGRSARAERSDEREAAAIADAVAPSRPPSLPADGAPGRSLPADGAAGSALSISRTDRISELESSSSWASGRRDRLVRIGRYAPRGPESNASHSTPVAAKAIAPEPRAAFWNFPRNVRQRRDLSSLFFRQRLIFGKLATPSATEMSLSALPAELLVQVLEHLEPEALSRVDRVSKLFYGPPSLIEQTLRHIAAVEGVNVPETLPEVWRLIIRSPMSKRKASADAPSLALRRLPANTLLYCELFRGADPFDISLELNERTELSVALPAQPAPGCRICEFSLARAAMVASMDSLGEHESIRQHGCDGWCTNDHSRVYLFQPDALLCLLDCDKVKGLAQASLLDMWWAHRERPSSLSNGSAHHPTADSGLTPFNAHCRSTMPRTDRKQALLELLFLDVLRRESGRSLVAAASEHSAFVDRDGTLFICGSDRDVTTTDPRLPPPLLGRTTSASASGASAGASDLGYGMEDTTRNIVQGIPSPMPGLTNVRVQSVGAALFHVIVLSVDGDAYSWGWGQRGVLGHGNTESVAMPKQISALRNACRLAVSSLHALVITTDGGLWSWGLNQGMGVHNA